MVVKLVDLADIATLLKTETQRQRFCVAYSGGLDSVVLLHSLIEIKKYHPNWSLRALHIHHGLNPRADAWQLHCEQVCQALDIPIQTLKIQCVVSPGESLEAVAREQRYAALFGHLNDDEVLLTAHHADDQAETLLLQLLRGAGVAGLAAMPRSRWEAGRLLIRPFLDYSRASLEAYAQEQQLTWVEDDSNANTAFDRNYLRHEVMPKLRARWPAAVANLQRSSQHCASALEAIRAQAQMDLRQARVSSHVLCFEVFSHWRLQRQVECVREWFRECGLSAPSDAQLKKIFQEVIAARSDASPQLSFGAVTLRRYRRCLYLLNETRVHVNQYFSSVFNIKWQIGQGLGYTPELGSYQWRFGLGGEKLKKIFQTAGIPPWERASQPLLFFNDTLIAVADYWVNRDYLVKAERIGFRLVRMGLESRTQC